MTSLSLTISFPVAQWLEHPYQWLCLYITKPSGLQTFTPTIYFAKRSLPKGQLY